MTRFIRSPGIFVCAAACWVGSMKAGNTFPIATNSSVTEIGGKAAYLGSNYLASLVSGTNIVGQLVSTNGQLVGSPVVIGANAGFPPCVSMASARTNGLAAWTDFSIASGVTMFGRLVSASGLGSSFPLLASMGSHGIQSIQAAASDGTNFLVVWKDKSTGGYYGQQVSAVGTLSGSEFLIFTLAGSGNRNVALTFGQTNYLIAWQDGTSGGDQTYGRLISRSGNMGSTFQINTTASSDMNPMAIGFDGTNYLAVWNRSTNYSSGGWPAWQLCGRLVSQSGAPLGTEMTLVTEQASFPALAFDSANYLLAWGYDTTTTNNDQSIHAQFFDCTGYALGPICQPFKSKGSNPPLLPLDGLLFDGQQFLLTATFGTFVLGPTGDVTGFAGGDVYGQFVPRSTTAPVFTNGTAAGGYFQGQLVVVPGMCYTMQISTDLQNWTSVGLLSSTSNRLDLLDQSPVSSQHRLFYRVAVGNLMPASFNFNFHEFASAGNFGSGYSPSVSYPVTLSSYTAYLMVDNDNRLPAVTNVYFSGPAGSGLAGTPGDPNNSYVNLSNAAYQSPFVSSPAIAPGGTWTVNYKGSNQTYSMADPQAASRLVIPLPTASVSGGVLQSVGWSYRNCTNGATLGSAPAYMTGLQVQVDGFSGGRIYDSPQVTPNATNHTLTSTVLWTNVSAIHMAYDDTLGNHYVVTFARP
jgi:hypothetical protein